MLKKSLQTEIRSRLAENEELTPGDRFAVYGDLFGTTKRRIVIESVRVDLAPEGPVSSNPRYVVIASVDDGKTVEASTSAREYIKRNQ